MNSTRASSIPAPILLLALFLCPPAPGQIPEKSAGFVTDSAHALTDRDASTLASRCARLNQNRQAQVAIVTVVSLQGEAIDQASLNLFRKWGIGRKGIDDGLLIMLATADRKSRITVGYSLEKIIPDATASSILQAIRPDLSAGRYAAALNRALDSLEKLLPRPPSPAR